MMENEDKGWGFDFGFDIEDVEEVWKTDVFDDDEDDDEDDIEDDGDDFY